MKALIEAEGVKLLLQVLEDFPAVTARDPDYLSKRTVLVVPFKSTFS